MWYYETNDGYRTKAYFLHPHGPEIDHCTRSKYTFFYTLDPLGRPTPRVASCPSDIVCNTELGARLVFKPEGTLEPAEDSVRYRDRYFMVDHLGSSNS
jgi:hypothetical protein